MIDHGLLPVSAGILPIAATSPPSAHPAEVHHRPRRRRDSSGRSLHICMCSAMTFTESRHSNSALAHVASALRFSNSAYAAASTGSCELDRSHLRTVRSSAAIALSSPARPRRHRPLHRVATARSRARREPRGAASAREASRRPERLWRPGCETDPNGIARAGLLEKRRELGDPRAERRLRPSPRGPSPTHAWTTVAARRRFEVKTRVEPSRPEQTPGTGSPRREGRQRRRASSSRATRDGRRTKPNAARGSRTGLPSTESWSG